MGSAPYLQDADFTLHQGDALEVLRTLPSESVDCCITSPPYWGLRDYGTGQWEGGDEGCQHKEAGPSSEPDEGKRRSAELQAQGRDKSNRSPLGPGQHGGWEGRASRSDGSAVCKCGATRIDSQLGLESTPEEYVTRMVEVFREVRRVLASHGTLWCNMGDSYNSRLDGSHGGWNGSSPEPQTVDKRGPTNTWQGTIKGLGQKQLMGMPWRLAFALQADGWYLRSDIVWSKPNPMPESVTDRPTKAHEYVFLLSKEPRYWFDAEAVREKALHEGRVVRYDGTQKNCAAGDDVNDRRTLIGANGERVIEVGPGRNIRSVWEIPTQPYPEAHFATFPEELVRRCLLAGCPEQVCGECGKARERVVSVDYALPGDGKRHRRRDRTFNERGARPTSAYVDSRGEVLTKHSTTLGFTDCGHNAYRPGIVLDPFMGSGTTALVARKHGRRCVGIELSEDYCKLASRRTQQLGLFSEAAA